MITKIFEKVVDERESGKTIKEVLKENYKLSNRIISNIKKINGILINGKQQNVNYILKSNDNMELYIHDENSGNIVPQEMPLNIVFEDDYIILVNKPPNLIVHPTTYHYSGTLANGIIHYFNSKGLENKFRPVNRLDKDTSGLILIAKNQISHSILSEQIVSKKFFKEYTAIVHNSFSDKEGIINEPIARKPGSIIERMVHPNGQNAITKYFVKSQNNKAAILKIHLLTGRTHQIRVHLSYIGHPIYGDTLYGWQSDLIERQALHCSKLEFIHPIIKQDMAFECEIPDDMKSLMIKLNLE